MICNGIHQSGSAEARGPYPPAALAAGGCAPADAMGLSTSHIRPQSRADLWQVNVYPGGSLMEVSAPTMAGDNNGGGKRGIITRFSEASRRRLLRALAKTKRDLLPVFLTLTYPDDFPGDPHVWKAHLKAWLKRLQREHPKAAGFWKLELKSRQSGENQGKVAPHFHLLLWGVPWEWESDHASEVHYTWAYACGLEIMQGRWRWKREVWVDGELEKSVTCNSLSMCSTEIVNFEGQPVDTYTSEHPNKKGQSVRVVESWARDARINVDLEIRNMQTSGTRHSKIQLREWVSLTWFEVVGSDDPRHLRAGTNCEEIRDRNGVMYYASKYVCKLDTESAEGAGRFWGIHNRTEIPWAEVVRVPVDEQQAVRLKRVARRYIWTQQRQREHPKKIRWRSGCGMSFFCDASEWLRQLPGLVGG